MKNKSADSVSAGTPKSHYKRMRTLHINARFAQTLRKQNAKEAETFAKHLGDGILPMPIIYWHNPTSDLDEIIDGHHRYEYAKANDLDFETYEMQFANESQAEAWIIYHQFSQRNVDDWAVSGYLQKAVKLERDNDPAITKREAVSRAAESAGVSERTVWRAEAEVKEKNPVQLFRESKADLERRLTREKQKAVEKFKVQAAKEQLDEDTAAAQWQEIEAVIDAQFAEDIEQVESLGEAASQAIEDNPGLRNTGKKRPAKKSVRDRAAKRNTMKKALSLIGKMQSEVLYFWQQNVGVIDTTMITQALKRFAVEIEAEQQSDAKIAKKAKFGGK